MKNASKFFDYARSRYFIQLRREGGAERPWTDDPILQTYRFCNVFREDDKVTKWFAANLREVGNPLLSTVAFRWFNRIEVGEILLDSAIGLQDGRFDSVEARQRIKHTLPDGPWVTGAYMIKTPPGLNKLDGVLQCIDNVVEDLPSVYNQIVRFHSLQNAHNVLMNYPYLGSFMAYEVVTDLRHTKLLRKAADKMTWANPGPGAARGLSRVVFGHPNGFHYNKKRDAEALQEGMQDLLVLAHMDEHWPPGWPTWEMREVEHTLCEFDKYERVRLGEGTPKQKFAGV